MINRFVCHLSYLSGEQWYGSQRGRKEEEAARRKKALPNTATTGPAHKIAALWTSNTHLHVTFHNCFLNTFRGSIFFTVMSKLVRILLCYCVRAFFFFKPYPLFACTLLQEYALSQPLRCSWPSMSIHVTMCTKENTQGPQQCKISPFIQKRTWYFWQIMHPCICKIFLLRLTCSGDRLIERKRERAEAERATFSASALYLSAYLGGNVLFEIITGPLHLLIPVFALCHEQNLIAFFFSPGCCHLSSSYTQSRQTQSLRGYKAYGWVGRQPQVRWGR